MLRESFLGKSVKQTLTVSLTKEAEFEACYEATFQVIWLKNFMTRLKIIDSILRPIIVIYDNSIVAFFSKNNKCSSKSKHFELKYIIVHERYNKKMCIEHISTKLVIVDPMTKALAPKVYKDHVLSMSFINGIDSV